MSDNNVFSFQANAGNETDTSEAVRRTRPLSMAHACDDVTQDTVPVDDSQFRAPRNDNFTTNPPGMFYQSTGFSTQRRPFDNSDNVSLTDFNGRRHNQSEHNRGRRHFHQRDLAQWTEVQNNDGLDSTSKAILGMEIMNSSRHHTNHNDREYVPTYHEENEFNPTEDDIKNYENNVDDLLKIQTIDNDESYWNTCKERLPILAEIRNIMRKREEPTIPGEYEMERQYLDIIVDHQTIKTYDVEQNGYIILERKRSGELLEKIERLNLEILTFAYEFKGDNNPRSLDTKIHKKVISSWTGKEHCIADGNLSIIVDLYSYDKESFPPSLWHRAQENTIWLRPAILDGIAVQFVSKHSASLTFYKCRNVRKMVYNHELNLRVKPIFDVLMDLLIRGHKTTVCLPTYYEQYITPSGISKVDDIFAFETLLDCKLIEFCEPSKVREDGREETEYFWIDVMREIVDKNDAIFISSEKYRKKRNATNGYKKCSDRIITPTFMNTPEPLMILQPAIRTRKTVIRTEEIMRFDVPANDETAGFSALSKQLYIGEQYKLICRLAQLYPLSSIHTTSVKSLLHLASFNNVLPTPNMTREDLLILKEKYKCK